MCSTLERSCTVEVHRALERIDPSDAPADSRRPRHNCAARSRPDRKRRRARCAGAPADSGLATRYAKVRQVCPAPKPGDASCFALALVPPRPSRARVRRPISWPPARPRKGRPAGSRRRISRARTALTPVGGSGQTVAIVDAYNDPKIEKDLGTFDAQYGLPACTTANGCFGRSARRRRRLAAAGRGHGRLVGRDVARRRDRAQRLSELQDPARRGRIGRASRDLAASVNEAVKLGATEVSNSYGALEAEMGGNRTGGVQPPRRRDRRPPPATPAISTGTTSAEYFFSARNGQCAGVAAAVVAVGGTSLKLNAKGARKSESVWNDSGPPSGKNFKQFSATGGGCSTIFDRAQLAAGRARLGERRLRHETARQRHLGGRRPLHRLRHL